MRFWWVNQKQTYSHEFEGGYLWAPKFDKAGATPVHWQNMTLLQPGDIVFSYVNGVIRSVGIIVGHPEDSPQPDFGRSSSRWEREGYSAPVEYHELKEDNRISPKHHLETILPLLPRKHSPIQDNGNGNQGYLYSVPSEMAAVLLELIGDEAIDIVTGLAKDIATTQEDETQGEEVLHRGSNLPTEKQQIVMARRGQGIFRSRVEQIESSCRVTKVATRSHLIASHIKPWAVSDDVEKLDGNNGLLLAPHIDHLFDKGFISFSDDGQIILSPFVSADLLNRWGIALNNVGSFSTAQKSYLRYHRNHVLKHADPVRLS